LVKNVWPAVRLELRDMHIYAKISKNQKKVRMAVRLSLREDYFMHPTLSWIIPTFRWSVKDKINMLYPTLYSMRNTATPIFWVSTVSHLAA
jgi:hypothetical protein